MFSTFEKEREFLLIGSPRGREAKSGQSSRRRHTHLTALQLSERTRCLPTKGVKKADSATPAEKTPELEHTAYRSMARLAIFCAHPHFRAFRAWRRSHWFFVSGFRSNPHRLWCPSWSWQQYMLESLTIHGGSSGHSSAKRS